MCVLVDVFSPNQSRTDGEKGQRDTPFKTLEKEKGERFGGVLGGCGATSALSEGISAAERLMAWETFGHLSTSQNSADSKSQSQTRPSFPKTCSDKKTPKEPEEEGERNSFFGCLLLGCPFLPLPLLFNHPNINQRNGEFDH